MNWIQRKKIIRQNLLTVLLLGFCCPMLVPQNAIDESSIPVRLQPNAEVPAADENNPVINRADNLLSTSVYIRIFLILGFLLVLIYVTLKFLRRLSLQKPQLSGWGSGIKILSSQVLHGERMLHVVEVGGECYLLASGSSGVQLLDHYRDQEVKDRVILETTQVPETAQGYKFPLNFRQLLQRHTGKQNDHKSTVSPQTANYRQRLQRATESLKDDK